MHRYSYYLALPYNHNNDPALQLYHLQYHYQPNQKSIFFLWHHLNLYSTFDFVRKFSANQNINKIIKSPVGIDPIKSSDDELLDHFKSNSTTIYHPCGTCRMSKSIEQGVVSEKLKVHGIDNLWVVDASIMPNITSGNINAPVMMLSHLSSKIILEELKQQYQ